MKPLTELEMQSLALVASAATKGPWKATGHDLKTWWTVDTAEGMRRQIARVMSSREHDAVLIAMARDFIPRMIAEIQKRRSAAHTKGDTR